MTRSVDERVVEMQFDNAQFEKGIKTTLSSLDKLKEKLNLSGATKGIESVQKAAKTFNMDSMGNSIDSVQIKLSALQIAGYTVIQNLTNTVVNGAKSIFSTITGSIIQGGINRAMNLEQAKFQLQGLGIAWKDIEGDISYGVEETAYGLDAAAKAAAQLSASGVQVGEQMQHSLRGISGVAAMTNSSYEDIAHVFTTVAGNGRLMASELNRIGARGLNAAAALGKYLGVSESEVREMTSRGEIDFQTFADAMNYTFGDQAKKANETFSGALANMKAALGRIGAKVAEPALANLRDIFNALRIVINNINKALDPFINGINVAQKALSEWIVGFAQLGGLEALLKSIGNLFYGIYSILKPVGQAFKDAFPKISYANLSILAKKLQEFTAGLRLSAEASTKLRYTFWGIFAVLQSVLDIAWKIVKVIVKIGYTVISSVLKVILNFILTITGGIGKSIVYFKEWIKTILQLSVVQGIFRKISQAFNWVLDRVRDLSHLLMVITEWPINKIFDGIGFVASKLGGIIYSAIKYINDFIMAAKEAFDAEMVKPETVEKIERLKNAFVTLKNAIGNVITKIKNSLIRVFNSLKSVLVNAYNWVKNLFSAYIEFPTAQEAFQRALEFFTKVVETVSNILKNGVKIFGEFINRVKEVNGVSFKAFISNIGDLKNAIFSALDVNGKLEAIKNIFGKFVSGISLVFTDTKTVLGKVKEYLSKFLDFLQEKFSGVNLGSIIATGISVGSLGILYKITKAITSFMESISEVANGLAGVFKGAAGVLKNIAGAIGEFGDVLEARAFSIKVGAITDIIKSLVLLAAALIVMSMMDQDKLMSSAIILGILSAAIIGITYAMSKLAVTVSPGEVAKTTVSIGSIAGGIMLMVLSLKVLETISPDKMISGIIGLGLVMTELGVFVGVMSIVSKEFKMESMVKLGATLLLMSFSLRMLASLSNEDIGKAIFLMGGLLIFIGTLNAVSKLAKPGAIRSLWKFMLGLAVFAVSFRILADIPAENALFALEILKAVFFQIIVIMIASSKAGQYADKAGTGIMAIGAAIALIAVAFKILDTISPEGILKGILALYGITVAIAVLLKFMNHNLGKYSMQAGVAMLAIGGSIVLIAAAMAILAQLDPYKLASATASVTIIMGMFAILIKATEKAKNAQKAIVNITIAIAALSGLLIVMSLLEPQNALASGIAIALVCGSLALIMDQTTSIGQHAKTSMKSLLSALSVVGVIALIIAALAQIPAENVLSSALGLSAAMTAFVGLFAVLGVMAKFEVPLPGLIAMAVGFDAVVIIVGGLFLALGGLVTLCEGMMDVLQKGVEVMAVIGNGIGQFIGSIVGGFASAMTKALPDIGTNLSGFMENLKPFLSGLSSITPDMAEAMKALAATVLVFTASDFINGMNVFGNQGDSFDQLILKLPLLGRAMRAFGAAMGNVDAGKIKSGAEAGKAFAEMMSAFPREGGLLGDIFGETEDMDSFAHDMKAFAKGLVSYANTVSEIEDYGAINNSISAAKDYVDLVNEVPKTGGLASEILGESDMEDFGRKMVAFGGSLVAYSDAITGNNESGSTPDYAAISESVAGAKGIVELANSLPDAKGAIQLITGGTMNFSEFGNQMVAFASALIMYSDILTKGGSSIKPEAIKKSVEAGTMLSELANTLPTAVGLFGGEDAPTTLGNFGMSLPLFGMGISDFCESVKEIDTSGVESACDAGYQLSDLAKELPENEGLFAIFGKHKQSLSSFGANIKSFGDGLKMFSDSVSGIDTNGISNTKTICNYFLYVAGRLKSNNDLGTNLDTLKTSIGDLGLSIKSYSDSLGGVNWENVDKSVTFIDSIANLAQYSDLLKSLDLTGLESMSKLADSISANSEGAVEAISAVFSKMIAIVVTQKVVLVLQFTTTAKKCIDAFANGLDPSLPVRKANAMIKAVLTAIGNRYWEFWNEGKWAVQGYADGMEDNTYIAEKAAEAMAKKTIEKVNETQDSHSPAKKYIAIARWAVLGYAGGFDKYSRVAENAAGNMVLNTMSTARNLLESMSEEEFAFSPTITPVLDLDNVNKGVGQINSLFNQQFTLSLDNARIKAASAIPIQNGSKLVNIESSSDSKSGGDVYNNFVQNNYSPKALSRAEIYRDSKSLFSRAVNRS